MDFLKRAIYRTGRTVHRIGWATCLVIGGLTGSAGAGGADAGPTTMPSVVECGGGLTSPKTTTVNVVGTCTVHVMLHAVGPTHSAHPLVVGTGVVHVTRTVSSSSGSADGSGGAEIIMMPAGDVPEQIIVPAGSSRNLVTFSPPPTTANLGALCGPTNGSDADTVAAAVKLIASNDPIYRSIGARKLLAVKVQPESRGQVLALLKPHLNDDVNGRFRLEVVQAYAAWATVAQERDLLSVVNYPAAPKTLSGAETSWAAAVEGLVRVQSGLVNTAVDRRIDWFCFRVDASRFLQPIADQRGPAQAVAAAVIAKLGGYRGKPEVAASGGMDAVFPTR